MQERYVYPPGLHPPQTISPTSNGSSVITAVDQNSPNPPGQQPRSNVQGSHHNFAELRSVASNNKMTGDSIKKGKKENKNGRLILLEKIIMLYSFQHNFLLIIFQGVLDNFLHAWDVEVKYMTSLS